LRRLICGSSLYGVSRSCIRSVTGIVITIHTLCDSLQHSFFWVECIFTSLLITASNGKRSPSSGFSNCNRASSTTVLGQSPHKYHFLKKTHSKLRHSRRLSLLKLNSCPFPVFPVLQAWLLQRLRSTGRCLQSSFPATTSGISACLVVA
jgi:hypothetical protein